MRFLLPLFSILIVFTACTSTKKIVDDAYVPSLTRNLDGKFSEQNKKNLGVYDIPQHRGYVIIKSDSHNKNVKLYSGIYDGPSLFSQSRINKEGKFVIQYLDKEVILFAGEENNQHYDVNGDFRQSQAFESQFYPLLHKEQLDQIEIHYFKRDQLKHIQQLRIPNEVQFEGLDITWSSLPSHVFISRNDPTINYKVDPNNENGVLFTLIWSGNQMKESTGTIQNIVPSNKVVKWSAFYPKETGVIRVPNEILAHIPSKAEFSFELKRNEAGYFVDPKETSESNGIYFMMSSSRSQMAVLVD
jgi:hypothetical protein